MCTIIAAVHQWAQTPLVIAANRDEALDRPARVPQRYAAGEMASRELLAPRDLKAGGTWIGINDAELFVGITNRRAPPDRSRRSRGELVTRALGAEGREAAAAQIRSLRPRDYNPFHLMFADRSGAQVLWSDGERFHELELGPGVHWITERSFDAGPSDRHLRLATLTAELMAEHAGGQPPSPERWRALLADHGLSRRGAPKQPRAWSVSLDALCVHAKPLNYGTRSSTYVELGRARGDMRLLHGDGRPCDPAVDWRAHT